jgi:hypothetical protein
LPAALATLAGLVHPKLPLCQADHPGAPGLGGSEPPPSY